jgi:hypothetical protein
MCGVSSQKGTITITVELVVKRTVSKNIIDWKSLTTKMNNWILILNLSWWMLYLNSF